MKRCYIAGPISKGDLLHNISQSDEAFAALARGGLAPFNPMWSCFSGSARRDEEWDHPGVIGNADPAGGLNLTHTDWLAIDLKWVEVADAVLRLPGESKGADMETHHARLHGIPVFTDVLDVLCWAENQRRQQTTFTNS